ncbi:hypothetical protein BLSTO_02141 [Blastocystis sp. subtype 1]
MISFFCFFAFLVAVVVEGGPTKSNPSVLPITMDVLVHQQYIRISLLKEMPAYAKLYCIPLKKGRPEPSLEYLKEGVQIHWENVIQPNTRQPYIIETDEVMEYDRLSCVYAERDQYFGPQLFDLIPNLTEEQTEVTISSVNPASDSVSFGVAVTVPVLVWCNAFSSHRPTIKELKMVRNVFVHKNDIVTVKDLTPNMNYTLFCYAESFSGTGMKNSVKSLAQEFTTTKMEAAIVDIRDENNDVAFSIKSNVEKQAVCKCIGDTRTVLAMSANNDYVCKNSIDLPLVLCRFYYPTQLVDVDYRREVDPTAMIATGKRSVHVIENESNESAIVYYGMFIQVGLLCVVLMSLQKRVK